MARTHLDIELAKVFFEILVAFAKNHKGQTVSYGELVRIAKDQYPDNPYVKSATAVGIGRRLLALRDFTESKSLPDLSALVINKQTKEPGPPYNEEYDAKAIRASIAEYDWASVESDFNKYVSEAMLDIEVREKKKSKTPKRIKESEARQIFWEYFKERRDEVGPISNERKEAVIKLIQAGYEPQQALSEVQPTTR